MWEPEYGTSMLGSEFSKLLNEMTFEDEADYYMVLDDLYRIEQEMDQESENL